MAGFPVTIEDLIESAQKRLVLVSPYIALEKSGDLTRSIRAALKRDVAVQLYVRADDHTKKFGEDEVAELEGLVDDGLELFAVANLHAKFYVSEKRAIITSLNLLASSMQSSIEIGIAFESNAAEFGALREWFGQEIKEHHKPIEPHELRAGSEPRPKLRRAVSERRARKGHCIRCGEAISNDLSRPYCERDFASWNRFRNADYRELFCHTCGEPNESSMSKPQCRYCYRKTH